MRGVEQVPWLYDALCHWAERGGLGRWRRWLVRGLRGRVLEVGAGTGRNLPLYPDEVRLVAVEPCEETLARARRRAPAAAFVRARTEALPFRDGTFEAVVSGLVFCSVADPAKGLGEVKRVLRSGGELRMIEHVRSSNRALGWLQDRVQPAWTRLAGGCHPNRDTEAVVEANGFAIDRTTRRARGTLRRFVAHQANEHGRTADTNAATSDRPA